MEKENLAFVFPGQGSQAVGMLKDLSEQYVEVKETFQEAADVLHYDLWSLVQKGPAETLNQTIKTQPAMLAAGVAVWRVWQGQTDVRPSIMAGHSLGEYAALVCAGGMDYVDAVRIVSERGRLMQEAVPEGQGAMAVVLGLEDGAVVEICEQAQAGLVCAAVNYNSPGQVVIAGDVAAVDRACVIAKEKGAKRAKKLAVSVPSHCALMKDAASELHQQLQQTSMKLASIPVIQNVDVKAHQSVDELRTALTAQLYSPVRWVETIQHLAQAGINQYVECGPGKVLMGLLKRIDRQLDNYGVHDGKSLEATMEAVL